LARLNKYDEAMKAVNIALKFKGNDLVSLAQKIEILSSSKQYEAMVGTCNEIIGLQPSAFNYLLRAVAKYSLGNKQEAAKDVDKSISINPKSDIAYIFRGVFKLELGEWPAAIKEFDVGIEIGADLSAVEMLNPRGFSRKILGLPRTTTLAMSYGLRGLAKTKIKDTKGAIGDLTKSAELFRQAENMEDYRDAMILVDKLKKTDGLEGGLESSAENKTIVDYDRAIALAPKNPVLYDERGYLKQQNNDLKGALNDYNQAIALNPKFVSAYNNRGNLKNERLNNPKGALADYNRAISLGLAKPQDASRIYRNRGSLKDGKLNDIKGALADYDKAIALDSKYADAYNNRGNLKNERLNNPKGALADYNRAISLDPKFVMVYFNRGNLKSTKLNDRQGALADYNKTIKLEPKFATAYFRRGVLKSNLLKDVKGAVADFNQAIALDSKFADAYFGRGNVKYQNLQDTKGALADWNKLIELYPSFNGAYYNLADIYYSLGNKKLAIINFQKVIALNNDVINKLVAQGVIYLEQGAIPQAINIFNQAARTSPDVPDIYKYRGLAYQRQGNNALAVKDWRKASQGYSQFNVQKDYEMVRGWMKKLGSS
jgi:tetratricopeptide (TPR) repeat protein